jgi:DEAD/DEAH box helicase domain-containing protein
MDGRPSLLSVSGWPRSLHELSGNLQRQPDPGQALAVMPQPAVEAKLEDPPASLHPLLIDALARRGITQLYSHQAQAVAVAAAGQDVVVTTATASGKTLCFNLPVIDSALRAPATRALYLYPTKALANDQLAALNQLLSPLGGRVTAAVFTGDTPADERTSIVSQPPNILIANPDILHYQQLANHMAWERWWQDLRWIVIDEAHTYRGVFGSHVAHVMRRVQRIADHYGARPQFIAASATIGNPVELVGSLTGRPPVLIDEDGSPRAGRDIVVWRPPIRQVTPAGPIYEAVEDATVDLVVAAMLAGKSAIAFARSRRLVERIKRDIDRQLVKRGRLDLVAAVRPYRAGYDADLRREIERGLRDGTIRAVVSTIALELGIDIGSLDIAVLNSYPGSTMSFWQQAGRAGRRGKRALVMLVVSQNPLDQYLARHPDRLVEARPEDAVLDAANPSVASRQLTCAAKELTLRRAEAGLFGEDVLAQVGVAEAAGWVVAERRGWVAAPGHGRPDEVSLRGIEDTSYALLLNGQPMGQIEDRYVLREAHPGAIYLHDGDPYRVLKIDDLQKTVILKREDQGLLTDPLGQRHILPAAVLRTAMIGALEASLVRLTAVDRITHYVHVNEATKRRIGQPIELEQPREVRLVSVGVKIMAPPDTFGSHLHGVEHLARSLGSLVVLCDPADLEGHTEIEGAPVAYVYDRNPGGTGLAERLFDRLREVLEASADRLNECECEDGCPACIQSGACLMRNDALDKYGSRRLLSMALSQRAP